MSTSPSTISDITTGAARLVPEMVLLGGLVAVLLLELVRRRAFGRVGSMVGWLTLAGTVPALWWQPDAGPFLQRMLVSDSPARVGGLLVVVAGMVAAALAGATRPWGGQRAAMSWPLLLAFTLGGVLLVRSVHGIQLVLAIELLSIPSYALVLADRRSPGAAEAALKYILLGAVATGAMLYGFSLLYGLSGSLHFADAAFWQNLRLTPQPVLVLAWALVLAGLLFKLGGAPLHFWVPDAYEAAPLPVALLLSTAPKAASAVAVWRLAEGWRLHLTAEQAGVMGLLLTGAALLTLVVGTLGALGQHRVRRLLGYSSVAQAGFLLLAVRAAGAEGAGVVLLYAAFLVLANGATFAAVGWFEGRSGGGGVRSEERGAGSEESEARSQEPEAGSAAYAGLGRRYPLAGAALTIGLVALTGLPPTVGFSAKLLAFVGLWAADASVAGRLLLGTGVLVTVASLFYYLRVPYWLFLRSGEVEARSQEPEARSGEPGAGSGERAGNPVGLWLAVGLAVLLIGFFVKADWLLALVTR